jgi:hypothetical protein
VLNSAISAGYYLRVAAAVLLYDNDRPAEEAPREAQHVGAVLCGFLIIAFSFYPSALLGASRRATSGLRGQTRVGADAAVRGLGLDAGHSGVLDDPAIPDPAAVRQEPSSASFRTSAATEESSLVTQGPIPADPAPPRAGPAPDSRPEL